MDINTGRIYPGLAAAIAAGVRASDLVTGEKRTLLKLKRKIRMASRCANMHRRAGRRIQKLSRKKNRRRK